MARSTSLWRRYAEFSREQGALSRRALIERAKGILMERHGITADETFERLRRHARNTNRTVTDVSEAVTLTYTLFRACVLTERPRQH
jgi:AmiR/NasT family two-component response regulator